MSNQEILEKAIQKAIDGGFDYFGKPEWGWGIDINQWSTTDHHLVIAGTPDQYHPFRDVIFRADFAKALWGETHPDKRALLGDGVGDLGQPEWQYHLQNMVVAEDPITYLGANI